MKTPSGSWEDTLPVRIEHAGGMQGSVVFLGTSFLMMKL